MVEVIVIVRGYGMLVWLFWMFGMLEVLGVLRSLL